MSDELYTERQAELAFRRTWAAQPRTEEEWSWYLYEFQRYVEEFLQQLRKARDEGNSKEIGLAGPGREGRGSGDRVVSGDLTGSQEFPH
jgi:uncharacterized damage-inducible protein DinB